MTMPYLKSATILALFCVATTITVAQTFTTLLSFDENDGNEPIALIQGIDGNLYGTSLGGGKYGKHNGIPGDGTAFRMSLSGTLTAEYSFCSQGNCTDGQFPDAGLVQAPDQFLYGTTQGGGNGAYCPSGSQGCGVFFKITAPHHVTNLYTFCSQPGCTDGNEPEQPLVQGFNGSFYGTTFMGGYGGPCDIGAGCGTVFKVTPGGQLTTIHTFCNHSNTCPDGSNPQAPVVVGSDGNIYGGANGGTTPAGTLFKITPSGKFYKLYQLNAATDGDDPTGIVAGTDGNLYGTAAFFGNGAFCTGTLCGTIFKFTPQGQFITLHGFCSEANCADGAGPYNGLIEGSDGNFYGTTIRGGANTNESLCFGPCGVIFKITPQGEFSTVYNFCSQANCADGFGGGTLMQDTNGIFYGTAELGGQTSACRGSGCGTIFSLDLGLSPFVKPNPFFGKVGYKINILGNDLTGTTSVTFNGTPATFTVVSDSYLEATVPSGATSGIIQVTTPTGTLSSHVQFQVVQ